jgi:hypothetical protein
MRDKRYLIAFLTVFLAVGAWSGRSWAGNLDLDRTAAALVLPVITGGDGPNPLEADVRGDVVIPAQNAATLATITNGSMEPVILVVDVISGDVQPPVEPSDACQTDSFICPLTGRETTTFLFTPTGSGTSRVDVECSTVITDLAGNILQVTTDPDPKSVTVRAQNGIMFVSIVNPSDPDMPVVSRNVLLGDAIVVDEDAGQAYSFDAIGFRAGQGENDGDKVYQFDDEEYRRFPSVLASNFLAPGADVGGNDVQAELILFTLDFTTGSLPLPRVAIGGFTYNDDEEYRDWGHEFDCFEIAALGDIDQSNNYYGSSSPLGLGSISGHLEMYSLSIATAVDSHDLEFGNGDDVRNRGFHGWLVQNATGVVLAGDEPIPGAPSVSVPNPAAWGRPLARSATDLVPSTGDQGPVLDAAD